MGLEQSSRLSRETVADVYWARGYWNLAAFYGASITPEPCHANSAFFYK